MSILVPVCTIFYITVCWHNLKSSIVIFLFLLLLCRITLAILGLLCFQPNASESFCSFQLLIFWLGLLFGGSKFFNFLRILDISALRNTWQKFFFHPIGCLFTLLRFFNLTWSRLLILNTVGSGQKFLAYVHVFKSFIIF